MKMEREIISKEFIKPSSPTPHHLRIHKLSLFDQIAPPIYIPLVQYFPCSESSSKNANFVSQTIHVLKRSLSETLTRYYPLAGRLRDELSVDCNDEGVMFVVTRIKGNLVDFLKELDPVKCRDHIACELSWAEPGPGSYLTTVQVNCFDCGAIAIGSLFFHRVTDAATIGTFVKYWASNVQNSTQIEVPDYISQSMFPHNEAMEREKYLFSAMKQYFKFGKTAMRRYVFNSAAISTLRARLSSEGLEIRPSRVEAVSALLWKCFMLASSTSKKVSLVTHGLNMRRKADPKLPDHAFGNFVWLVPASAENETDVDVKDLVCKVRKAITKVDSEYVAKMQGDEGFPGYLENLEESLKEFPEDAEYFSITSWCNFGLYDIDFGWGCPIWITKCDAGHETDWPFINVAWLMDTREGDGIEAWVTVNQEYVQALDNIEELKTLASIDPSPLQNTRFDDIQEISTVQANKTTCVLGVPHSINHSAVPVNGES